MQFRVQLLILLCTSLFGPTLFGEDVAVEKLSISNPALIIKNATSTMIEQLTINKQKITEDKSIVMSIVEELLIPHFASNTISRKVMGKHARRATKEQKTKFANAFRFYMVRFYSRLFATFSDQTFKYFPSPATDGKKKVTVKTQLIQAGTKPISVNYNMQRSGDTWKIIDLKIEGISMVISNKNQFGRQISAEGIDSVIAKLEYKNNKAAKHE